MELFSGSGRKCWSVGAENQDPFPANRGFRSQVGCQRRRRRTKAGYGPPRGHPEATLRPSGGHSPCSPPVLSGIILERNRRPARLSEFVTADLRGVRIRHYRVQARAVQRHRNHLGGENRVLISHAYPHALCVGTDVGEEFCPTRIDKGREALRQDVWSQTEWRGRYANRERVSHVTKQRAVIPAHGHGFVLRRGWAL